MNTVWLLRAFLKNLFAIAGFGDPQASGNYLDGYLYELGNASSIKGTVFMDYNSNGIKEASEPYVSNVMVKTEKTGFVQSAIPFNGSFKMDVDTGTYHTTAVLINPYYTISPGVHNTTFNAYFNTDSFSFAVQPIPGKRDLSVSLIPLVPARPGFQTQYKLFYKNKGTDTISAGTVQLVKSNKLSFISSIPALSSVNGDTLRWNYSNLKPEDSASIIINLRVAAPPAVNIGDALSSIATISPVATDLIPSDDTSRLVQTVIGSYDPNDKTENNGGVIRPSQVKGADYLLYTIRFQNTGTDTAFNVVIRDTLSDKVDWNSLQMVSSSHNYQLNIKDGNKLTWSFNDIKLVDSFRNEPASHGYIVYKIKPQASLLPGDTIKNTAGIYFDYNLPVSTNMQRTVVESSVLPVKLVSFVAKRNGKQNEIEWYIGDEANLAGYTIERSNNGRDFKTIGNVKANYNSSYNFMDFLPERAVNYYRLKITNKDGEFEYSTIKRINNNGTFEATIYPNPVKNNLQFKIDSEKKMDLQLQVVELNGRILSTSKLSVPEGSSLKHINVTDLSKGTYFLRVITEGEQTAIKFDKL
ncbi:MAG: hypothetical protein JWQ09_4332 [Segetibacter sp.]|nr:hypothetical protein [Segetibacter sp.]